MEIYARLVHGHHILMPLVRNKLNQMFGLIQGLNTSRALEAGFSSDDAVQAAERVWAFTEDAGPNPTVVETAAAC